MNRISYHLAVAVPIRSPGGQVGVMLRTPFQRDLLRHSAGGGPKGCVWFTLQKGRCEMRYILFVVLSALLVLPALAATAPPESAHPVKAAGSIELKDPAGDMDPITTTGGEEPPLDVVLLAIRSDGKQLGIAATLNEPPGNYASDAVTLLIDVDNNPATGTKGGEDRPGGFEYKVKLCMCIKYDDGVDACEGGSTKGKPVERSGAIDLDRFKGDSEYGESETVVDTLGFFGKKASPKVPVAGKIVQCTLDYADLGLKPGQTIRILPKETGGAPKRGAGSFPIVLLTVR
jgi:hypothetical protein